MVEHQLVLMWDSCNTKSDHAENVSCLYMATKYTAKLFCIEVRTINLLGRLYIVSLIHQEERSHSVILVAKLTCNISVTKSSEVIVDPLI